jgi:hypothetical protein
VTIRKRHRPAFRGSECQREPSCVGRAQQMNAQTPHGAFANDLAGFDLVQLRAGEASVARPERCVIEEFGTRRCAVD